MVDQDLRRLIERIFLIQRSQFLTLRKIPVQTTGQPKKLKLATPHNQSIHKNDAYDLSPGSTTAGCHRRRKRI